MEDDDVEQFSFENSLYGSFFTDVDACRRVMYQKRIVASGDAVLHAFGEFNTWIPSELDLYMCRRFAVEAGLLDVHEFLLKERYRISPGVEKAEHYGSYVSVWRCVAWVKY